MNLPEIPKPNLPPTTITPLSGGECGNCHSQERWLLHSVRLRGVYRRFCTSCVLRNHPSSFCPYCLSMYDSNPPPPSKRLTCSKCCSYSHSHCAPSPPPSQPFLCPPCADPSFSFFPLPPDNRLLDKKLASALLCAAGIAASSMAKAVMVAKAEAERRVKEAAACRKRAREALEHVAFVLNKDKLLKTKETESSVDGVLAQRGEIVRNNGNAIENGSNGDTKPSSLHNSLPHAKEEDDFLSAKSA